MDLKSTQLKDTYGNLLTIGTVAGSPQTGTLQNGDGEDITALDVAGTITSDGLTSDGNISLSGNGTGTRNLFLGSETASYAGAFRLQAGGASAGYGGGITMYGHSHASKPGDVAVGISNGSGGSFRVNSNGVDTGSDLFEVKSTRDIVFFDDADNEAFYWDASAGSLGIGISPSKKLTVFGTGAGNATVQIEGEGGADPYINFLANNTQHWSLGVDDSDSDKFKLSEHSALGTNDYLVVDTSGNVGIGTDSPTNYTNGTTLEIKGKTSTGAGLLKVTSADGTVSGALYASGSVTLNAQTNHDLIFATNNSEKMRILSGGGLTFNGDTASANALDDYEEGTHDVTITCSTSGTITLNNAINAVSYTKIGRLVTVTGQLGVTSVSSPLGAFRISLPFTIANLTDRAGRSSGSIFITQTSTNADNFIINAIEGENSIKILKGGSTNGTDDSADTFSGDEFITLNFSYVSA